MSAFRLENKLLVGFVVVVTALFFYAGGFIVTLTGWTFLQSIARLVLVVVLFLVAVFFSYDTVEYYRYYHRLKATGQPQEVTVLATDRHRVGRGRSRSSAFRTYNYDATYHSPQGERVIPITEDEYDQLRPKDQLRILYSAEQDDAMSATYPGNYWQLALPLFFWVIFGVVSWNTFLKPQEQRPLR